MEFTCEYDFGTTSELSLRVVERDDHHCGLGVTADYGDAPDVFLPVVNSLRVGLCAYSG